MKAKVAIALAFAGGTITNFEPADAKNAVAQPLPGAMLAAPTAAQIIERKSEEDEFRAYRLLKRADGYLRSTNRASVEQGFPIAPLQPGSHRFDMHVDVTAWAKRLTDKRELAAIERCMTHDEFIEQAKARQQNADIAVMTINEALKQLDLVDDKHNKLDLYYISSLLLRKAGDEKGAKLCEQNIEKFIHTYQTSPTVYEAQIVSANSVLKARAYQILAIDIPEHKPDKPFSFRAMFGLPEQDLAPANVARAEALLVQGAAIADKLEPTSHARRMAHRDLSLWYKEVGKNSEAEYQKQILFSLIGEHSDKLLYPASGACGHVTWWTLPEPNNIYERCGMG